MRHHTPTWGLATAAAVAAPALAADFFISPSGRDTWSGTKAQPVANDGPFATLERVGRAVRELKGAEPNRKRPIVVQIRGGTHYLPKTLAFRPEDSGTEAAPVVYEAYPGERPVLSGGRPLTGWRPVGQGRWQIRLEEVAQGKQWFEQLYVSGQRRFRPCLPSDGYHFIEGPVGPSDKQSMNRFKFKAGDLRSDWHSLSDVHVHVFHSWSSSRLPIKEIDESRRIVTLAGSTWNTKLAALKTNAWYRVENVLEALDEPGEWYLDRASGVLTYLPMPGEDVQQASVVAPHLNRLVDFNGNVEKGTCVEHIVLRGLTFEHSSWTMGKRGYTTYQAEAILNGAVTAINARSCAIEDCVIRHTGTHGIDLGAGCRNVRVERCQLVDLAAGGIKIGTGRFNQEEDQRKWADGCIVRDCLIAQGGRIHPGGVGVWIGHAANNTVEGNEIRDFYYSGISVGWRWAEGPSPAHHNTIARTYIHHIGQGVLSDMAGIYTLGESPGTVLRLNRIHDVGRARYGGWGIYFDQATADVLVENNLVYRTEDAPFHIHWGSRNIVRNNIFAFGHNDQIKLSNMKKSGSLTLEGNIWYWREGKLFNGTPDDEVVFKRNLYWQVGGATPKFPKNASIEEWQQREEGALVADPLFVGPDTGNFALQRGSPAERIGFKPFEPAALRAAETPAVLRAFPSAPPAPPLVVDQDFELLKLGRMFPGWGQIAASREENVHVTDEIAATGKQCLKFNDGPGGAVYFPHIYRDLKYDRGVVKTAFDLRVEPGAKVQFEWRDKTPWYTPGPSIEVDPDGTLKASRKPILKLPHGQWVHIEMLCGIGPQATGAWDLTVTLPDEEAHSFDAIPCRKGFEVFEWMGFASMSRERVVYYVDNFVLTPVE